MRVLAAVLLLFSLAPVTRAAWAQPPRVEQNVCMDCHTSDIMKEEYRAIPGEWRQSWHYQNGVACQDCHGGDPRDAARSMTREAGFIGAPKPKEVPEFCGKCHLGIKENYLESAHGKALLAAGGAPNCVDCHGSHKVQKATINIISEELCGICHSYDRAKTIKESLFLTEEKITRTQDNLKRLKAGLIPTGDEEKALFATQAEFRTLFHTQEVNLVKARTAEFDKRLASLNDRVLKGFKELKFRQDFSILLMLIFIGLGVALFLLSRNSK